MGTDSHGEKSFSSDTAIRLHLCDSEKVFFFSVISVVNSEYFYEKAPQKKV
jgi:hypothetical protein